MKDNGKTDKAEQEMIVPAVMATNANVEKIANDLKRDINSSKGQVDTTKYYVMQGMQDPTKKSFFTQYENMDDVMRMNTIEMYAVMNIHITRKINPKFAEKLRGFYADTYQGHIDSHKTNMTSVKRAREEAYVRMLAGDNGIQEQSSGWQRFLGFGNKKK